MKRLSHDQHIDALVQRLSSKYEFICKNVEYQDLKTSSCGEIDILAKKDNFFDLIEVKCTGHYQKAVDQLYRARNALECEGLKIRLLYYSGEKDLLKLIN